MKHTHSNISSKFLRKCYATELWQARKARVLGKEPFANILWGLESGIWAVQKGFLGDLI